MVYKPYKIPRWLYLLAIVLDSLLIFTFGFILVRGNYKSDDLLSAILFIVFLIYCLVWFLVVYYKVIDFREEDMVIYDERTKKRKHVLYNEISYVYIYSFKSKSIVMSPKELTKRQIRRYHFSLRFKICYKNNLVFFHLENGKDGMHEKVQKFIQSKIANTIYIHEGF